MTYFIDPFGCAKNQVDAENMMAYLNKTGWAAASDAAAADLIIVNSCGFIESAKQESINAVLAWRKHYPGKKILLAGCLAQRYSRELAESLPEADGLFGLGDWACLSGTGERPLLSLPGSAYVKISEGCDNRCSFCAIPLIRGPLKSRSVKELVEECKALLGRGIGELCLIGQDLGSYGRDLNGPGGLCGLLEELLGLEGDFWLRLLYVHPDHFPLPILDLMEREKRLLPYFDIPFQHGSEKILRAMGRQGNAESYLGLIKTIRSRFPDAVIRSTFMTGFPGETQEDFELLLDFQQKASLDWLGCFAYSREEDTPAYSMKGRVAKKLAAERKSLVEEAQIPITERQMDRFIGRSFDVLVEEKFAPGEDGLYLGRLPCHAPEVDGAAVILDAESLNLGARVPCQVTGRSGFDLRVRPKVNGISRR